MKSHIRKTISRGIAVVSLIAVCAPTVFAEENGLMGSKVFTGTQKLINDATTGLTILCPIVGGLAAVYCLIRKALADEQDGKLWNKRITMSIICGVAGMLVTGIIAMIASYYTA